MEEKEMSFLDHLEELRWHIIRAVGAVLLLSIVVFVSKDFVFGVVILGPMKTDFWTYRQLCEFGQQLGTDDFCIEGINFTLQSRQMTGQFSMHLISSFVLGFVLGFPYVFWEIWRFVRPALYPNEKTVAVGAVFWVSLLFLMGALFGYYLLTPVSVNFLANYVLDPSIQNQFDITSYVSTLIMLVIGSALMFQLPMAVLVLARLGIVTPAFMRKFRRHSIVIIFIVAAIITPADVFTQFMVAIPLILLYEVSIFIAAYIERKRIKAEKALRLQEAAAERPALDQMMD